MAGLVGYALLTCEDVVSSPLPSLERTIIGVERTCFTVDLPDWLAIMLLRGCGVRPPGVADRDVLAGRGELRTCFGAQAAAKGSPDGRRGD